jgi:hypothetical protein
MSVKNLPASTTTGSTTATFLHCRFQCLQRLHCLKSILNTLPEPPHSSGVAHMQSSSLAGHAIVVARDCSCLGFLCFLNNSNDVDVHSLQLSRNLKFFVLLLSMELFVVVECQILSERILLFARKLRFSYEIFALKRGMYAHFDDYLRMKKKKG